MRRCALADHKRRTRRRLANVGANHWSFDAGGGYTYFDPRTGHEFPAVAGVTYNLENPDTDYRNGVDAHIDWVASQFFSESLHAGIVGYFYRQLTGDSGAGAVLGDFKSSTYAIGPQVGGFFPVGSTEGYVNLRGYWEFATDHTGPRAGTSGSPSASRSSARCTERAEASAGA